MPYGWTRLPSSDPKRRRDDVKATCGRNHASLCENQTFYDDGGQHCWALIQIDRGGQTDVGKLMTELGTTDWKRLVSADEKP